MLARPMVRGRLALLHAVDLVVAATSPVMVVVCRSSLPISPPLVLLFDTPHCRGEDILGLVVDAAAFRARATAFEDGHWCLDIAVQMRRARN